MPLLVDVRQLRVVNELLAEGAANVADAVGRLAGVETEVTLRSLGFVDPADLPTEVGTEEGFLASVGLAEPPYGVFMLSVSRATAEEVAALVTGRSVGAELAAVHRSALRETCNICTSGFVDGIANTLETTIDTEAPALDRGGERAVRERLSHVERETIAMVLDAGVSVPDHPRDIGLHAALVPSPGAFVNLLDAVEVAPREEPPTVGEH
jgi:chemotaxis protein CheC